MENENGKQVEESPKTAMASRICSDYDEDCKTVSDHTFCFMGGIVTCACGNKGEIERADGICPFVQRTN